MSVVLTNRYIHFIFRDFWGPLPQKKETAFQPPKIQLKIIAKFGAVHLEGWIRGKILTVFVSRPRWACLYLVGWFKTNVWNLWSFWMTKSGDFPWRTSLILMQRTTFTGVVLFSYRFSKVFILLSTVPPTMASQLMWDDGFQLQFFQKLLSVEEVMMKFLLIGVSV